MSPQSSSLRMAQVASRARASFVLRPTLLASALAVAFAAQAQSAAQADAVQMKETVVTANRIEQPLSDLVADMSVVGRETIETAGAVGVADVLSRLPGVQMVRNGGAGSTTSVYLRGADTRFTAVYIDGIRVDSQSTGGASWQDIPLEAIDRIEVLRGPAAAVYGSDAIGGVVQIFTKKGEGKAKPYVGLGWGSRGTVKAQAGVSGGVAGWDYSLGVSHASSNGFNAKTSAGFNPDADGYRNNAFNGRVGYQINSNHRVEATALTSYMNAGYDATVSKTSPMADDRSIYKMNAVGLNWLAKWSDVYSTRLQYTQSRDFYQTKPSVYETDTRLHSYLFQNEWRLGAQTVTAALERREDKLVNNGLDIGSRNRSQNALALGYGLHAGKHTLQLNARHDRDSEFGGHTTGSAAYGYEFMPNWRATASAGTAFRAPTLYQRFSQYGDASLSPEKGRNVELGLKWGKGSDSFSATLYRNNVSNLINYVGGTGTCAGNTGLYGGCYANVAKARYEGITLAATTRLGMVNLQGSVDFQDPRDTDKDLQLARRSKRYANLSADTTLAGWKLGAEMQAAGKRFDDAANKIVLGGYTLWNLSAQKQLTREWSLVARINNLADKRYELARTYATEGRSGYIGVKWEAR
ncbi:TonB-dependent receptor [Comamonas thiooxydans]|uniref:TonB-dependent receptor n=1 Tax=Comamonas thiooxydans TaxID=363952 RepID=A0AA42Q0A3_9BURK|nr:TonB-dependent receptor [Comamonas thiooxydans]MDH1334780.1 TonB-dependent receptor [Comamonas thiooxydans]MDH1740774.1 TonB-dependent receptor [Comamonas thiooxydans]MDH1786968.1 TonB-dependent receptor [Comamonas thiooxydans]